MRKQHFTFVFFMAISILGFSQYYYIPHLSPGENPGALNTDSESPVGGGLPGGWTTILAAGASSGTASTIQSMPFYFEFNGAVAPQYRVNNHGVLTFDILSQLRPGPNNATLPSTQIPDKSICVWGISSIGANDNIVSKTFGTAPNRQHWVMFSSYTYQGFWTYWAIVFEETSNAIYIVDQRHQSSYSGLTIGLQIDTTTAIQLPASPNVATVAGGSSSSSDNAYYEFIAGQQPDYDIDLDHLELVSFPNIADGPIDIHGALTNLGARAVTSYDLNYRVNGGTVQTANIATNIVPGGKEEFSFPTPWTPTMAGNYTVEVWSSNINGNPDQNPANDSSHQDIVLSPAIPNIIDNYLSQFPLTKVVANTLNQLNQPMDLDFHPDLSRKELWVINYDTENSGGSTVTFSNVGMPNQSHIWKRDGNAWHFMSLPTGIAFSDNGNFANSPGVFDANHNGGTPFTGPALWSSDPAIYAQPSGGNGSHLDMLHASPNSLGIAHEKENVFWVVDGFNKDVVRYDFSDDHGPGNSDHDDGGIRRVTDFRISMVNNSTPSHLVLDKQTGWLYIVDIGNKRILRMDINSGQTGGTPFWGPFETLAEYSNLSNTTWEVVVDSGLVQPTGIDVIGDKLIVGDYSNGHIIIYDLSGPTAQEAKRIDTGFPGLTGIKIGPEGFIWYVNKLRSELVKVELAGVSIDPKLAENNLSIYPNPTSGVIWVESSTIDLTHANAQLMDLSGKIIQAFSLVASDRQKLSLQNVSKGVYLLKVNLDNSQVITKKVIIN